MGFVGGDEKGKKTLKDGEIHTQVLDSDNDDDSSPPSGEKFEDRGMQFDDTLPLDDNFLYETELVVEVADPDIETQVLEDVECNVDEFHCETQLLEDQECIADECEKEFDVDSDAGGTEGTEVLLSDNDEVSDDAATPSKGKDANSEKGVSDGAVRSEKQTYICPRGSNDQSVKNFIVDSDTLIDDDCTSERHRVSSASLLPMGTTGSNPGSVQRSFTAIRAASLRSFGLAAALSFSPKGTNVDTSPSNNSESTQRQEHAGAQNPSINVIAKDDRVTCSIHPTSFIGTEVCEQDQDHASEKCHSRNARSRELFHECLSVVGEESINGVDCTTEKVNISQSFVSNHGTAGLSYVGSQEPGEQSQADAWDIVDKFLSFNEVELSGGVGSKEHTGGRSPHIASAKGAQNLAKRSNPRSPVGKAGVFDWIDSHEDEGGGEFFSKRKDALLESRHHVHKSHTEFWKPKRLNFKRAGSAADKFLNKEEGPSPQISQKIIGLTHSDSRLMLQSSTRGDGVQFSEVKVKRNLITELDALTDAEVPKKQLEGTADERGLQDVDDVGIDTQLAAEAMEALFCAPPAGHDNVDVHPVTKNSTEGSATCAKKKKSHSKHVSVMKRSCSAFESEETSRKSKQRKRNKVCWQGPGSSRAHTKNSRVKISEKKLAEKENSAKEKCKHEGHLNTGQQPHDIAECLDKKSSKFINRGKTGVSDVTHIENVDLPASDGHASISKGQSQEKINVTFTQNLHVTFTPIAKRTRQSKATNSLKKKKASSDELPVEDSIIGKKRRGSNSISHPKGRRTCHNIPDYLNNAVNRNVVSISGQSVAEVNAQSSTWQKRVKTDVGTASASLDMVKRRRISGGRSMLPSLNTATDMLPKPNAASCLSVNRAPNIYGFFSGTSIPSETNQMASTDDLTAKTPKNLISHASVAVTCSGQQYGIELSTELLEHAEGYATLEGPLKGKVQSLLSGCATPSKDAHAVSPVCVGDGHQRQSGKEGPSRSSIARELIRLVAPEAARTPALKYIRRPREMASVSVLFSRHLGEDVIKQQKKISARLGVSIASSSWDATHFIADRFVRTRNMLEAIALGKPVVTHLWLESCGQASCFIDEKNYILRDTKKEKEIGFSMPASLAQACHIPLLEGKRVFITPNVKPDRELVASLVKAVRGQAMERIGRSAMKDEKIPDDLLIISCEEDYAICMPFLEKGAEVYCSELLLNGIIIQKLEYKRHQLFIDHVKKTRSTIWLRSEDGNQFYPMAKHT